MPTCPNEVKTADTSQSTLRYIKEDCWGEIPAAGDMQELRFTSEGLGIDRATTTSEEIRIDRQVSDLIPTKVEASGEISGELSYTTYNDFIEAALCNDWEATVDATVSGVTVSGGKLLYPVANLPAFTLGQALRLAGFTDDANNIVVVVTDMDTITGEVTVAPVLVDETPAGDIVAKGHSITNGIITKSFFLEKEFTDVGKVLTFLGMAVNQMTLNIEAEAKVGVSFSFMGKNGEALDASLNPGNVIDATTTDIMSSGTQYGTILEGTTKIGLIKSLSLEASNNLRGKTAIGVVGNVGVGKGRFNVRGSISAFFEDFRIYEKYLKNQSSSLVFTLGDAESGTYVFNLPHIKFTESTIVAGGPDQDVMVEGGYQALMDPITKKTLIITKIDN